jgi:hypothetical protein
LRDVLLIATQTGWSRESILALPPAEIDLYLKLLTDE